VSFQFRLTSLNISW